MYKANFAFEVSTINYVLDLERFYLWHLVHSQTTVRGSYQSWDCSGSRRNSAEESFPVINHSFKRFFITVHLQSVVTDIFSVNLTIYLLFSWTCVLRFWPSLWSWRTPQSCTYWARPGAAVPCMPDPDCTEAYTAETLQPPDERIKSIKHAVFLSLWHLRVTAVICHLYHLSPWTPRLLCTYGKGLGLHPNCLMLSAQV